jgi:hypothetical protein
LALPRKWGRFFYKIAPNNVRLKTNKAPISFSLKVGLFVRRICYVGEQEQAWKKFIA